MTDLVLQVVMTAFTTGAVGSAVGWLASRPKTRAEAASIATDTTGKLLDRYETQHQVLTARVEELEAQLDADRQRVRDLDQHVWTLTLYARKAWSRLTRDDQDDLGPVPTLQRQSQSNRRVV